MKETDIHKFQAQYERYVALTTSQGTAIRYSKALENFFKRHREKNSPEDFTKLDIEDYKVYRLREGVSTRTVNYEVQVIKTFWTWMIRMDVAAYNPATSTRRLKEIEPRRESLSLEDQDKLYATVCAIGSAHDRLLTSLVLSTGLRAETLIQLETSDVDLETRTLRIPAEKMKAGRNHEVPLRQDVIDLIVSLPEGRFFEGYAHNAKTLSYRFSRLLRRSGSRLRGLRTGRRSFATTLLRTGADIGMVQTLMGHRSVLTTSKYITPADSDAIKGAVNKLPRPQA
jgi:integrase/recombinase XerD